MKTHYLIFATTVVMTVLFYNESLGLNVGILGIGLNILTFFKTKERNRTRGFLIMLVLSILSSFAFAWYGDFVSFLAIIFSLLGLRFKAQNKRLKSILAFPIMGLNALAFPFRFFDFDKWMKRDNNRQKMNYLTFIIPVVFCGIFFGVYSMASSIFSEIYLYQLDIDAEMFAIACLSFFFAFNYWHFSVARFFLKRNQLLQNDFTNRIKNQIPRPIAEFLDIDAERKSGVLTFIMLNLLLIVFIGVFNYEQFFQPYSLESISEETHDRVAVVILSIIMAVLVIMFYFKSHFNFDKKADTLRKLAQIWVLLNAILVISTMMKNTEYVYHLGLTYKRLGVYAFLILCLIGLYFTSQKISKRKTNLFLFSKMQAYFYGTILVCSFINWGYIITAYNLQVGKGNDFDFLSSLEYNERLLMTHFPNEFENDYVYEGELFSYIQTTYHSYITKRQNRPFFSKTLYYETFDLADKP